MNMTISRGFSLIGHSAGGLDNLICARLAAVKNFTEDVGDLITRLEYKC